MGGTRDEGSARADGKGKNETKGRKGRTWSEVREKIIEEERRGERDKKTVSVKTQESEERDAREKGDEGEKGEGHEYDHTAFHFVSSSVRGHHGPAPTATSGGREVGFVMVRTL